MNTGGAEQATIEDLTARVAELEDENKRLKLVSSVAILKLNDLAGLATKLKPPEQSE